MRQMLNVFAPAVVIAFSLLFFSGCSDILGDQRQQAEDAVTEANGAIEEHNRLFDQARESYATARENIEAGEEPEDQEDNITEAQETLQRARDSLQDAAARMEDVREMDVDPVIKRYAGQLAEAMEAQLSAEAREIEFYEIMEEDPALTDNRERALEILGQAGDDYERADESYAEARELASSNPKIIKVPPATSGEESTVSQEAAPNAPEDQQQEDESGGE